jgi:hypothetical protein
MVKFCLFYFGCKQLFYWSNQNEQKQDLCGFVRDLLVFRRVFWGLFAAEICCQVQTFFRTTLKKINSVAVLNECSSSGVWLEFINSLDMRAQARTSGGAARRSSNGT